ncbi:MAG TPA: acetylglutamate kinase [Opitutaceae bacterium]|jgi:acetylglutamate kinase|nr:acetylglutamate kinase [Opitutaceae bacterium]OQB89355.1 MAG: Acetylglutamate kinase [Verrucomicrobia bacterium ADurb.Bin122]MBP8963512.1 acetylglutamate kinase [Opitutaceae bacterium]HNW42217.1 acetylglutamate kinase [Opitutaceae bacterium]HOD46249.1 acetylglutamate kinase [Opitutaceae bacterium]
MKIAEITAKAKVLLEALPYIQDFRGSTFVVKYGGSFMDDPNPEVRNRVAYDIAFLAAVGINVVVVHGGGKAITKAMQESGLKANFINGLRVTDEPTIQIVKKTLDEIVNRDVCAAVSLAQGKPKGLAGDSVLVCEKLTVDDNGNEVDLGFVGDVTEVKAKLIKKEIADGFIPIISPVAEGLDGKPYNINADTAAGRVASALRARRLVYMSDVPGLLSDPKDPTSLISTLKVGQVDELKKKGVIDKGMRPKVGSAVRALQEGVQRVHFIDGRLPHSLLLEIFTDKGIGTEIVHG